MTQQNVQFDENGFALSSGFITVYKVDKNNLFIQSEQEWVSIDTSISPNAYLDEPLEHKDGFAIKRTENGWEYIEDHRGKTFYDTQTQEKVEIKEVGKLPENLTALQPFENCKWDSENQQWVKDIEKEKQQFKANQQALIITLKNKADELGNQLLHEYPQIEQTSFAIQKEEAIAWQKDNSHPTPVLTGIATARNLELSELVARVIRKTTAFESVTGIIAGQRQAIMDKLEKATEQAQLDEIKQEIEQWQLSI
ncbi:Bacteriophage tail assembly protein [Phocoenobacter uteri]|uniref:Bacteriophage tail assembly protein n=1 Tax=Phocoenobacter uteri TaxID=146806 RepID=A0A379CA88_9PAST|nr:hypothetical protein [Phocoenobacter uteri]MDG6881059.1 hypothetical protein [Phocoenobacter uteri]SUB59079.1 Bacteriophage tail assembly protein [Phocoenobacter uteri]